MMSSELPTLSFSFVSDRSLYGRLHPMWMELVVMLWYGGKNKSNTRFHRRCLVRFVGVYSPQVGKVLCLAMS